MSYYTILAPRSGAVLSRQSLQPIDDVRALVSRARRSLQEWIRLAVRDRRRILGTAANLIRRDADALANEICDEQGKPWADARSEILKTADVFQHFAIEPEHETVAADMAGSVVDWEPLGVVAAIVPNNYPATLAAYKSAPALAAGCAVIIKPDLQTPSVASHLARLLVEAGVPDGVIQTVYCENHVVEHALIRNPGVDAVSFTGSAAVGAAVASWSQDRSPPARTTLELGGINSLVVEPDADLSATVDAAVIKAFRNAGQVCHGISSVLIHEAIREKWTDLFIERARALRPATADRTGSGHEVMGPLTTPIAKNRIEEQIAGWRRLGSAVHRGDNFTDAGGWFHPPVVICPPDGVADHDVGQELFGPAVVLSSYRDLASTIDRINQRSTGLVTYLFGKDQAALVAQAKRLQCGSVGVNTVNIIDLRIPFGGWKASGLGFELGPDAERAFQRPRHIRIARGVR